jgi:hypothetical protein
MIQRILFTKLKQGQLDESGLDMADMRTISNRMAETLVNMHHHRIKYQWQARRAEEFGVPSRVVRDSAPQIEVSAASTVPPTGFSQMPPSETSATPLPSPSLESSGDGEDTSNGPAKGSGGKP